MVAQHRSVLSHLNLKAQIETNPTATKWLADLGDIIHPNRITALRAPLPILVMAIHRAGFPHLSALSAALIDLIDYLDGAVARSANKTTVEGARLDPGIDKIVNTAELAYLMLAIRSTLFDVTALLNIVVDLYSQRQRGSLEGQFREGFHAVVHPESCHADHADYAHIKANNLGKIKKTMQSVSVILALAYGQHEVVQQMSSTLLAVSAVLGVMGTMQRRELAARPNGNGQH